jgi:hypothetical protein
MNLCISLVYIHIAIRRTVYTMAKEIILLLHVLYINVCELMSLDLNITERK